MIKVLLWTGYNCILLFSHYCTEVFSPSPFQSLVLTHHSRNAQNGNTFCFLLLVLCCLVLLVSADLPGLGLLAVFPDSSCLAVSPDSGLSRLAFAWPGADRLDKWQVCPLAPCPGPDMARCPCPCPSLGSCHQHKLGQIHQSRLSLQGHNRKAKQQPELGPEL